jgi:hypothetical protein
MANGEISVAGIDDLSGVTQISVIGQKADGTSGQIVGTSRSCAAPLCASYGLDLSTVIDPVALNWQTGSHHLSVRLTDNASNTTTVASWDVTYYRTSWAYGGADRSVTTDAEVRSVIAAVATSGEDSADARALLDGLSPTDRPGVDAQLYPTEDPVPEQDPDILVPPDPGDATAAHTFYCNWVGQQIGRWMRPLEPYVSSNNVYGAGSFSCEHGDAGRAVNMKTCIQSIFPATTALWRGTQSNATTRRGVEISGRPGTSRRPTAVALVATPLGSTEFSPR